MRWALLFLILFYHSKRLYCQSDSVKNYRAPQFVGGKGAFKSYLHKYVTYPDYELEHGIEAGLSAVIYVSKEGSIKFVNVLGSNAEFRKVLKRVLTLMPDWIPAKVNNLPADTFIIQRFVFSQEVERFPHDSDVFELNYYTYWPNDKEAEIMRTKNDYYLYKARQWNKIYKKGIRAMEKQNYEEAIKYFMQSNTMGNNEAKLYYNLSVAYYNRNDMPSSCLYLREAALRGDEEAFKEYLGTCKIKKQ